MSVPIFQVSKLRHRDTMRFRVAAGVWPCSDPLLCAGHDFSEEFQNGLAAHLRRRHPFWPGEETQTCRQAHAIGGRRRTLSVVQCSGLDPGPTQISSPARII